MHAIAKALAISAAVAWVFLGVAAILVLNMHDQPVQMSSYMLAGIVCLAGLAMALGPRGSSGAAMAIKPSRPRSPFVAAGGAAITLIVLIMITSGPPSA